MLWAWRGVRVQNHYHHQLSSQFCLSARCVTAPLTGFLTVLCSRIEAVLASLLFNRGVSCDSLFVNCGSLGTSAHLHLCWCCALLHTTGTCAQLWCRDTTKCVRSIGVVRTFHTGQMTHLIKCEKQTSNFNDEINPSQNGFRTSVNVLFAISVSSSQPLFRVVCLYVSLFSFSPYFKMCRCQDEEFHLCNHHLHLCLYLDFPLVR